MYGRQSELSGSEKQPARQEPRDVVEELIHSAEANAGAGGGGGGPFGVGGGGGGWGGGSIVI